MSRLRSLWNGLNMCAPSPCALVRWKLRGLKRNESEKTTPLGFDFNHGLPQKSLYSVKTHQWVEPTPSFMAIKTSEELHPESSGQASSVAMSYGLFEDQCPSSHSASLFN